MDVAKPYKFIGFGAMDVTKRHKVHGFFNLLFAFEMSMIELWH